MTVRNITGNIKDLAGNLRPETAFDLIPMQWGFGDAADTVVLGDIRTIASDGSGNVDFDAEEGIYALRFETRDGRKSIPMTVDSEGPWNIGRLIRLAGAIINDPILEAALQAVAEAEAAADTAAASASEAEAFVAQITGLTADATTLAPGSPATASYDEGTGVLSLGIPEGVQGDTGPAGEGITDLTGEGDNLLRVNSGGTGVVFTALSTFGESLIDDADESAARTTLGLGDAATKTVGTAEGNVVGVLADSKLPVLDGSNLTGIRETYESSPTVFSASSMVAFAHGLSAAPKNYAVYAVCTTSQAPYVVGDEVLVTNVNQVGGAFNGVSIMADSTNLKARVGPSIPLHTDTGGPINMTIASWQLIVRASVEI